jgi:hypothetical protein
MCLLKNIVASRRNLELDAEAHNDTAFQQGWDISDQGCQMIHIVSNQKSQFGYILEDLGMENAGICYGRLGYLTAL